MFNIPDISEIQKLAHYGFVVGYTRFSNGKVIPMWTADFLLEEGFAPAGTRIVFTGWNGTLSTSVLAKNVQVGDTLTVKQCFIEGWNSYYEFEEIDGRHHVALFERWVQQDT